MKLVLAILIGMLTAAFFLLRLWTVRGDLESLGGIIADSRRSRAVAVLNLLTFASAGLLGIMLAASRPVWQIILVLAIGAVAFVCSGLLSERLRPSPIYGERYPEDPRSQEHSK